MSSQSYHKRTIIREQIASDFLRENRRVKVFLPPGYENIGSYPVIYCQDGDDFFQLGRIATFATQLILDENMDPPLIVGVEVDKTKRTSEYAPEGSRFAAYLKFFHDELIPFIEARYAARREPSERILAGDSLGATVSLHLALDYPDTFSKLISLSGAFLPTSQLRAAEARDLQSLHAYMLVGEQETEVATQRGSYNFLIFNREMSLLLRDKGAKLAYLEKPGKHTWGFWQKELPDALRHFLIPGYTLL